MFQATAVRAAPRRAAHRAGWPCSRDVRHRPEKRGENKREPQPVPTPEPIGNPLTAEPRPSRRRRLLRAGGAALSAVLVAAAAAGLWVQAALRASLPQLTGTAALPGLSAPVAVERDTKGVPRVRAQGAEDAFRALGFLHGQERFFQMDLMRRQAAGELSALVGAAALPADREARLHRMRARAERAAAAMPEDARRRFTAYRDGVNRGLEALDRPPFEYLLLRQEPAEWRIADSLLAVVAMYFVLNDADGSREARSAALEAALPAELAAFLNPPGTERDAPLVGAAFPTPEIPDAEVFARALAAGDGTPGGTDSGAAAGPPPVSGSNSWAAAPERTVRRGGTRGAGMVAGDMHLALGVPNRWYRAELLFDRRRLAGLTLPGVPALISGSNGRVAWAFTNSGGDWTDLVDLEFDGGDESRYRAPGGFRSVEVFEETIEVADGPPETLSVRETIWGPITTRWGRPQAIRWIAHDPEGLRTGYVDFSDAEDLDDAFRTARRSGMPPQNLVAADANGDIGWSIAGPIPRRRGLSGAAPTSWADGERGWEGYLPPEEVPEIRNPPSGLLWTANNRLVDGEWLDLLGRGGGYAHGGRAARIRDRLFAAERLDEPAMLDIQLDDRAVELEEWRNLFLPALDRAPDPPAAEAARVLRQGWDGRASVDSAAYRLLRDARIELLLAVYEPLTEPARLLLPEFSLWVANQWPGPLLRLARERPSHFVPPGAADWNEALAAAALRAARAAAESGPLAEATWGKANRVHLRHPLSPGLPGPVAGFLDAPPRGLPGDSGLPRAQSGAHGPSNRLVVSPGREEDAILHMPGGQSGHPLAPYYLAGNRDWEEGRPVPLLAGEAAWTLVLRPPEAAPEGGGDPEPR